MIKRIHAFSTIDFISLDLTKPETLALADVLEGGREHLILQNNPHLKELVLPFAFSSVRRLTLRNLLSLERLVFQAPLVRPLHNKLITALGGTDLFWIEVEMVPALRTVELRGPARYLRISQAPMLSKLDLSLCCDMEHCEVDDSSALKLVCTTGALKLAEVRGLAAQSALQRTVTKDLEQTQALAQEVPLKMRRRTVAELADDLALLNEAAKAISRGRLNPACVFPSGSHSPLDSLFGGLGLHAYRTDFNCFELSLLPPEAKLYSDGTRCSHVLIDQTELGFRACPRTGSWWHRVGDPYAVGGWSQDDVLGMALSSLRTELELSKHPLGRRSDAALWQGLKALVAKYPYTAPPEVALFVEDAVPDRQRQQLSALCAELGIRLLRQPRKQRCLHVVMPEKPRSRPKCRQAGERRERTYADVLLKELKALRGALVQHPRPG